MIDEETAADGGAGVDLDSRQEAAKLRNHTRYQRPSPEIQFVGQAVRHDGMKTGVAEQHLYHALGGRVLPENGVDLFPDGSQHAVFPIEMTAGGKWIPNALRVGYSGLPAVWLPAGSG